MVRETKDTADTTKAGASGSNDDDNAPHWVYVIEIAAKWYPDLGPTIPEGKTCLYVGQSKRRPRKRFKQHRRGHPFVKKGGEAAANPFRDIAQARLRQGLRATLVMDEDARLRRDLMDEREPVIGKSAAEDLEFATAERLRGEGYYVFGPKPSREERRRRNAMNSKLTR